MMLDKINKLKDKKRLRNVLIVRYGKKKGMHKYKTIIKYSKHKKNLKKGEKNDRNIN